MKYDYSSFLCCPGCKSELITENSLKDKDSNREVIRCKKCKRDYTIIDGIIHFLKEDEVVKFSRRMNLMRSIYARIYTPATRIMFLPCGGEMKARHEVLDRLELSDGATVLETGIGCGDNLPILKTCFETCVFFGLDNQLRMIRSCSANLKKWNIEANLYLADAERLPFRDNMFDVVFHLGAFNLFRKKRQAMDEMIRVAKPGTRIVIADESEKASKLYGIFLGKQEPVVLPDNLVSGAMLEKQLDIIWNSYGYVLSFRKPFQR
jgi:ubiquinone/menaquinone biosynthesis C-methylase UbiE